MGMRMSGWCPDVGRTVCVDAVWPTSCWRADYSALARDWACDVAWILGGRVRGNWMLLFGESKGEVYHLGFSCGRAAVCEPVMDKVKRFII